MTRVKRGTISNKTRKYTLKAAKGYRFGRSTKERMAFDALSHAGKYAFHHRRDKKSDFRRHWQTLISAALLSEGMSYSKFMGALKKKNIELDRKILAELAQHAPLTFKKVLATAK